MQELLDIGEGMGGGDGGDCGSYILLIHRVVAGQLTREFGKTCAVLNEANTVRFGGGVKNGGCGQQEDMFRRTDW